MCSVPISTSTASAGIFFCKTAAGSRPFPCKYVFSKAEYDHWSRPAGKDGPNGGVYEDSVLPVVEAGLAEIIDGAGEVAGGLLLRPTPGHTVGHLAVQLAANGDEA
jgi:glyoxylase-like metal-dependent hydrolase (beta-lactamase superfamily II)